MTRLYALAGGSLLLLALIVGLTLRGTYWKHDATRWHERFDTLRGEAGVVLHATRAAADNPKLDWPQVAGQVVALGESNARLKDSITVQNRAIDDLAAEAVRLRAHAAELRRIADKAEAQRASALKRLSDLSITPGTREDCLQLLREAEEALDIAYKAGL